MALGWLERMYISTDEKFGSSGASETWIIVSKTCKGFLIGTGILLISLSYPSCTQFSDSSPLGRKLHWFPFAHQAGIHFECNLVHHGEGNGYPLQYSCLENPMDRGDSHGQRSLAGYSPRGHTSQTRLSTHTTAAALCGLRCSWQITHTHILSRCI